MSLKAFHIVFIVCSGLLALGTAAWALSSPDGWQRWLLTAGAVAVLAALVPYGVWFRRKMRRLDDPRGRFKVLLWLTATALAPDAARACAVCWGGESGSSWIDASTALFTFMLLLTYGLLGGGVVAFVVARRGARDAAAGSASADEATMSVHAGRDRAPRREAAWSGRDDGTQTTAAEPERDDR